MKITITLDVPEGTPITVANGSEYLAHEDHPRYKETGEMSTNPKEKQIEDLLEKNKQLVNMIANLEKKPNAVPALKEPAFIPERVFHCEPCDYNFTAYNSASRAPCPKCKALADLAEPPKDDTNSIVCCSCGKAYDKRKGGRLGTCPDCTTVKCPTCKAPAQLSDMVGMLCVDCRMKGE